MIRWRQDQQNLSIDYDTGQTQLEGEQRHSLEQAVALVRKRCHDLPAAALHVRVGKDERLNEFEVELVLEAMQRSLRGIGKAELLADAVDYARDKIVSQLGPFKAQIRRQETYRLQHSEDADPTGAIASSAGDDADRRKFEKELEAYWRPLVRQVSREISALEMNNLLPLGELAAQDIVDEVIVRAFEQFRTRPAEVPLEIWLYQQARQVLTERREQLQQETPMSSVPPARRMAYAEPPPPPNPLTEPMDVLMELLEPEPPLLPGEDVADTAHDPTLPHERSELHQLMRRTISQMPPPWREAIWLHFLDGFDAPEIAAVQGRGEPEVRSDLEQAVSRLRDVLRNWRDWSVPTRERPEDMSPRQDIS